MAVAAGIWRGTRRATPFTYSLWSRSKPPAEEFVFLGHKARGLCADSWEIGDEELA